MEKVIFFTQAVVPALFVEAVSLNPLSHHNTSIKSVDHIINYDLF